MRYFVTIQKQGEHGNPRVPGVAFTGWAMGSPVVGKRFMVSFPDRQMDFTYLHTSEVQSIGEVIEDQRLVAWMVATRNSLYQVKISHTEEE